MAWISKLLLWTTVLTIILTSTFLFIGIKFIGFGEPKEELPFKCPPGQVMVLENAGTDMARFACYSPGVSYTDYRPMVTQLKD